MILSKEDWESDGFVIWFSVGGGSQCGGVDRFKVNDWGRMND